MPKLRRRRRALRAVLGLAVVLALGFAADAVVFVTTRARADGTPTAAEAARSRRSVSASAGENEDNLRTSRSTLIRRLTNGTRPVGADPWSLGMIGLTLALAVCGGIIVAGRRFGPHGTGMGMQVIGRVSLSPKQTVYLLQVGRRVLLVGAGSQGSPSLISELDDLAEIQPESPRGEQP